MINLNYSPTSDPIYESILISLFTNAREPEETTHQAGWWADCLDSGPLLGSQLWRLSREKVTDETLEKSSLYIKEALNWMITEQIVRTIDVQCETRRHGINALITLDANQTYQVEF